jgi:hypothetical protein
MLKSTHRPSGPAAAESPLPSGWSEHKAPTGHTYYYNAETKQSTYARPAPPPPDEPLQIDYGATEPDHVVRASLQTMQEFYKKNDNNPNHTPLGAGHFTGGRSYQDHSRRRGNQGDRPKTKTAIPNCAPWVLVKTKFARRFVHNTETKQSLWKFPQDVMMAVIEMDRMEWEAKKKAEAEPQEALDREKSETAAEGPEPRPTASTEEARQRLPPREDEYDSDSYEEVEVTDDEAEGEGEDGEGPGTSKRRRLSQENRASAPPEGPVEFNEDDIAWQLAEMEQDYDDDYGNGDVEGRDLDEEDEGLPLTATDNLALFRSLLDDSGISPYSIFEKLVEDTSIVEDTRYVALPTTSARREAFVAWSKDRIAELQAFKKTQEQAQKKSRDPRVEYLRFLQKNATPKLYWPEFKRKFKKEPEMRDLAMPDKDREKLYRELVSKLKTAESERRKELVNLLKSADKGSMSRDTKIDELPDSVLRDVRFYSLDDRRRDELVRTFLETQ